jgi:hypothetical protein
MEVVTSLREQFASNRWLFAGCLEGLTESQLWWMRPGSANPIADNYLHLVINEDGLVLSLANVTTRMVRQ